MSQYPSKEKIQNKVALGDRVWIERLKDHGVVVAIKGDGRRAVVELNKVRFNLELSCLAVGRVQSKAGGKNLRSMSIKTDHETRISRPIQGTRVPREIDMHGLRVEDMLVKLDDFLNEALLGRIDEVRIIHGHGSGALKNALHQRLKEMGIRHFRLGEPGQTPGGDGVTIISLA